LKLLTCKVDEKKMNSIDYALNGIWNEYGDPRIRDFYLMDGGPLKVISIVSVYLILVKYVGPRYMKNHEPMNIKPIILIYNALMVGFNGIGFLLALWITDFLKLSWDCSPIDRRPTTRNKIFLVFGYCYFISKFADLLDTVFFVLRKKQTHVSALHVIHHGVMPLCSWFALKMHPSNYTSFLPAINSFVHTLMYSYYAMACSKTTADSKAYLRFKRNLTQIQMFQFILVFFHSINALLQPSCHWPAWLAVLECLHSMIFFFMFSIFYKNAYLKKNK